LSEHNANIASAGGKARMESMTSEERVELARSGGKAGGAARKEALSKKRRSEIAAAAAKARWAKKS
jgi:hypothetical protein